MFTPATVSLLQKLHAYHLPRKGSFYHRSAERRRTLLIRITEMRNTLLDEMFERIKDVQIRSQLLLQLRKKLYDYFTRSDWALVDMVALAACTSVEVDEVSRAVAPNALLYHSLRMVDDVLDLHQDYKGGEPTLFGELSANSETACLAIAGNLIPAMIMMANMSAKLTKEDRYLFERTLIGALHESLAGNSCTRESYRRIAVAKMGAYGLFLYHPVVFMFKPAAQGRLEQFLKRSFFVAQMINDLQDQRVDEARHQPNYWLLGLESEYAVQGFVQEVVALANACREVANPAQDYAHARVTDLIAYLLQVVRNND